MHTQNTWSFEPLARLIHERYIYHRPSAPRSTFWKRGRTQSQRPCNEFRAIEERSRAIMVVKPCFEAACLDSDQCIIQGKCIAIQLRIRTVLIVSIHKHYASQIATPLRYNAPRETTNTIRSHLRTRLGASERLPVATLLHAPGVHCHRCIFYIKIICAYLFKTEFRTVLYNPSIGAMLLSPTTKAARDSLEKRRVQFAFSSERGNSQSGLS